MHWCNFYNQHYICSKFLIDVFQICESLKIKMCPNLWSHCQFLSISPRVKSNLDHHRCFHLLVLVLNFKQLSDIFPLLHLLIMITQWSDKCCWILWNFEKAEGSPNLPNGWIFRKPFVCKSKLYKSNINIANGQRLF